MSRRFPALVAVLAGCLFFARPASAMGIGVEAGGTATYVSGLAAGSNTAGSANVGILVENNFNIALLFLDLWADVQTPLRLSLEQGTASVVPIDLGLRLGVALGPLQPYLGVLGQMGIVTDSADNSMKNPIFGLGGDLGLDVAFFILRAGIEVRAVETTGGIASDNSLSAFELEGLGSVRLAF